MFRVALAGVRASWQVFTGLFICLVLSVGVLYIVAAIAWETPRAPIPAGVIEAAAAGVPSNSILVRMNPQASFPGTSKSWLACERPLPGDVQSRVAAVTGVETVIPVKTADVAVLGRSDQLGSGGSAASPAPGGCGLAGHGATGRAWSNAALTGAVIQTGRAPSTAGEVVLSEGAARQVAAKPGQEVTLVSTGGLSPAIVTGIANGGTSDSGARVYVSDDSVLVTGQPVTQLVVWPIAGTDASALAARVESATSDITGLGVETAAQATAQQAQTINDSLVNQILAGMSGFALLIPMAAVFVVGSTASFSVSARRRDTALLRLSGAGALQSAVIVVLESAVVAVLACLVGCVLGALVGGLFIPTILNVLISGPQPQIGFSPVAVGISFAAGVCVAAVGSIAAAWRAARVTPVEALRDSVLGRTKIAWLRLSILLVSLFALWNAMTALSQAGPSSLLDSGLAVALFAVIAGVAAAPWVGPALVGLISGMLRWTHSVSLLLGSNNLRADRKRTASVTAALVVAFGITTSMFTMLPTASALSTNAAAQAARFHAVLTPDSGVPFPPGTALRPNQIQTIGLANYTLHSPSSFMLDRSVTVAATDLSKLSDFIDLGIPTVGLGPRQMLLSANGANVLRASVGDHIDLGLPDGTITTLQVAGIYPAAVPMPQAAIDQTAVAGHVQPGIDTVWVRSADPQSIVAIRRNTSMPPATTQTSADWITAMTTSPDTTTDTALVIGVPVALAILAATNVLLMSAPGRQRELRTLRCIGAGTGVVRMLLAETVLLVLTGVVLAVVITAAVAVPMVKPVTNLGNALTDLSIQVTPVALVVAITLTIMLITNTSLALARGGR